MRDVRFTDEAESDYCNLPDELIEECDEMLNKIAENINFGQRLFNMHGRDLSDCRKIYFNDYKHRIVYRKVNETDIEITGIEASMIRKAAEIIAIGKRSDEEVYRIAAERLGRAVDSDDEDNEDKDN